MTTDEGTNSLRLGIWRLADPKVSLASMASIFLGACAAARDGAIAPGWLVLTIVGIFGIEVAKNASGDIYDFDSGADQSVAEKDRSPFSGGKRVLVDGLMTRRQTWAVAVAGYAAGIGVGLVIVALREPRVLWLGLVGVACAFFYHAPPFKFSYRGLGEIAVAFCYGPLIACGTYLVQRGEIAGPLVLLSLLLGVLIAAFLWINQLPDYHADVSALKRNLVARLGRRAASRIFPMLVGLPFAVLAVMPLLNFPVELWMGMSGLVPAGLAALTVWRYTEDTARLIPAQAATLTAFLLFSLGCGVGLLLT